MEGNILGTKKISKLFLKFCIPAIVSMVIAGIQPIIDGIFLGNFVGTNSMASVNIVQPFMQLIIGFSMITSVGALSFIGRSLGEGKKEESQNIFKKHIGEMLAADRDPMVQSCARCTQAILDYKQRRISIAHETLDRLLEKDLMPLQKAVALYYKGLILRDLGKCGSNQVFEQCSTQAGNTVFRKLSDVALESV